MAHRPIMRARATVAETAWCAHVWALRIESTTRRNVRRRQCKFRYLEFQLDQILHGLAYSLQRQLRVLGDLEVAGEAAPDLAVALALVFLRQHADLGVDQCLELCLLRRGEVVAGLLGRLRDYAETTTFRVVTGEVFGPLLVVAPVQTARLRFRSAGREDDAQPPLAVLMAFSDVRQAQHALVGCCGLFLHAPGFVAVAGEQGVNAARLDAPRESVIF